MAQYGSLLFVLHSHLPYVIAHGKWPHGMDWLNEAAAETYVPILQMLDEMLEEGYTPKLTVGITPVLTEQLADTAFKREFRSYLQNKIEAAQADQARFAKTGQKHLAALARFWENWYLNIKNDFEGRYYQDLVAQFRRLSDKGCIDIITCGATHGYFPLLSQDTSIQAQVKLAIATHRHHYGKPPRGIWLPECAYRPAYKWRSPIETSVGNEVYPRKGIEEFLSENGIEFFFVDSALTRGGKAIGVYVERFEGLKRLWQQYESQAEVRPEDFEKSYHEIYLVNSSGQPEKKPVAIFTRDPKTGLQIWSGEHGYPGDGWYLDFHKKHFPGGHRYWRVTSPKADLADKQEYEPERVEECLEENSSHFALLVESILKEYFEEKGKHGVLTAPFDTELFGHWWFEGPRFLKKTMIKMLESDQVLLSTASEELDRQKPVRVISIPEGSWGEGGYHYIWLNKDTEWTWKHIYPDEVRMQGLAREFGHTTDERLKKILEQTARELLLLQASDWQFLISTFAARDYAELRLVNHHSDFTRLAGIAEIYGRTGMLSDEDWSYVEECNRRDSLFKEIDLNWWREVEFPAT